MDTWSYARVGSFRAGLACFSRSWTRSLHDHMQLIDTWVSMATVLAQCRLLVSQMHNLEDKAKRIMGHNITRIASTVADISGLLSQLRELHLAWTAWLMKVIGSNARRTGGGYTVKGFGEAAWLRFHIHHRLRAINEDEPRRAPPSSARSHRPAPTRLPGPSASSRTAPSLSTCTSAKSSTATALVQRSTHPLPTKANRFVPTPSHRPAATLPLTDGLTRPSDHRQHTVTPHSAPAQPPRRRQAPARPTTIHRRRPVTMAPWVASPSAVAVASAEPPSSAPSTRAVTYPPPPRPSRPSGEYNTPIHQRLYMMALRPKESLPLPPSNVRFLPDGIAPTSTSDE